MYRSQRGASNGGERGVVCPRTPPAGVYPFASASLFSGASPDAAPVHSCLSSRMQTRDFLPVPPRPMPSHPITTPSHFHRVPFRPIPSHSIPSGPIASQPIISHSVPLRDVMWSGVFFVVISSADDRPAHLLPTLSTKSFLCTYPLY